MDNSVLELIKRSAAIPSMPQVVTRFLEITQDPDFDFKDLTAVLSTDPGTASEVLRLANSSLFGVTRQVTSLQQAMTLLGLKRIRSLVLGRYIVDSIDRKNLVGIDTSYYWRRSLTTAVLAAQLADALAPELREEAFISGLLADVGIVILDEGMPQQYRPIAEQYCPHGKMDMAFAEETLIGVTHAQVSALVLEHWRLPNAVCEAVRWHPWERLQDDTPQLARIVGAADRIGKYLCESTNDPDGVADSLRDILRALQLEGCVLSKILEDMEGRIGEFAEVLHVDVISSGVYRIISDALRAKLSEPAPTPA